MVVILQILGLLFKFGPTIIRIVMEIMKQLNKREGDPDDTVFTRDVFNKYTHLVQEALRNHSKDKSKKKLRQRLEDIRIAIK